MTHTPPDLDEARAAYLDATDDHLDALDNLGATGNALNAAYNAYRNAKRRASAKKESK
ncbi:hypothetical protein GCM10022198_00400 [Klugiella xanthotipulae]|uniref:Uncharacterized protein n=1 Tax=Klugiella xanthotipulae TaxID=244735 RepID=A0A543I5F5_9MICO|nr:hypothetical protein [Klugiella xanthotipulae]TQM65822.1 hypothetical protein FB466_0635 [Klugiella xanthotipulae]